LLPTLKQGDKLKLKTALGLEGLSRGPARYTEASLIRKLEEMGIGRPSTYAPTLSTIESRGYVERGDIEGESKQVQKITLEHGKVSSAHQDIQYGKDSGKLHPTEVGKIVTDFLIKHFAEVMEYDFTKNVEIQLDEIAERKKDRVHVLRDFYRPFHKLVEASAEISRAEVSKARLLGKDPVSGQPIYARFGKFGPVLQKGENDKEEKPGFAPLPKNTTIETVKLEQALEMFKLPRLVGKTKEGQDIKSNVGRFGPYIQVGNTFVSIKSLDPFTITETEARKLYNDKLVQIANKNIQEFGGDVKVINGPYGPYVTNGKRNVKIPDGKDPKKLTEEECLELLKTPVDKMSKKR
jgi:DNA topoisomerase I